MATATVKVSSSILAADLNNLRAEVKRVEQAGVDMIHVDVIDGQFGPNITFGPAIVEAIRRVTHLPIDLHLMVYRPERLLKPFIEAGSDIISTHLEACNSSTLKNILSLIESHGRKKGIALKPETKLSPKAIRLLDELDMFVVMSVPPGFSGQRFNPTVLPKIRELKSIVETNGLQFDIEADGGINVENAPSVVGAGATILVAGAAIFGSPNIEDTVRRLKGPHSRSAIT